MIVYPIFYLSRRLGPILSQRLGPILSRCPGPIVPPLARLPKKYATK